MVFTRTVPFCRVGPGGEKGKQKRGQDQVCPAGLERDKRWVTIPMGLGSGRVVGQEWSSVQEVGVFGTVRLYYECDVILHGAE